jgi:phosphonate transport system permease protein
LLAAVGHSPSHSKRGFPYLLGGAFALTLALSMRGAQVDPRLLFDRSALDNLARFATGAWPPKLELAFLCFLARPMIETIQISVVGMIIAVLIGAPLGILATASLRWRGVLHEWSSPARRIFVGVIPYAVTRGLLSVFRSIPEYVWAFLFVRAVGLGPFPGVLAIGIAYGGMLGKVYSEVFEGLNLQPVEALQAAGSRSSGLVFYSLLPGVLPHLVSYTLYRWECAIRASAILGFVGAGGLGQQIELSMRMFQFDEVLTLIGALLALVLVVDVISSRIRARVLA